jgi:hypothetical protein
VQAEGFRQKKVRLKLKLCWTVLLFLVGPLLALRKPVMGLKASDIFVMHIRTHVDREALPLSSCCVGISVCCEPNIARIVGIYFQ